MTPEHKREKRIYLAVERALSHVPGIKPEDIRNAVSEAVRAFKGESGTPQPSHTAVKQGLFGLTLPWRK